ncbi:MAG: hypothetical protein Fur0035_21250 [Anaerolineales bacterium]
MQSIANHIYIEDQFAGVTLGAVALPQGLIQIDAPPAQEDGRSWRASLLGLNSGVERLLVNLDSHPDRTLGARAMDCTVIAHEKTAQAFRNRPGTLKAQNEDTGADWELVAGPGSIRWALPEITFTERMAIQWSGLPLILEHHPGPAAGACWAIFPEQKIVFLGDLVVKNQPPFLANANLPDWLASLETLLSPAYANYTLVSGRGGIVTQSAAREQLKFIQNIHQTVESLGQKSSTLETLEKMAPSLLAEFDAPGERLKQYTQRLRHGLRQYYYRRYHPANTPDIEEE